MSINFIFFGHVEADIHSSCLNSSFHHMLCDTELQVKQCSVSIQYGAELFSEFLLVLLRFALILLCAYCSFLCQ